MYECPNCGGNLKFNISLQQLFCAYCESAFDPYSVSKETDTVDGDCFETNVFRCPQCGGEMISSDNDATSFCSYCGSANILSERIGREKRPKHIIPFQITKDGCKKAYAAKLRKAFFVPKELKDPAFIDGFRGIYMPYWSYRISQQGQVALRGEKEKRSGDYVYTDHYALTGDLDAGYEGYSCDASAGFSDNISEALGPYDIRDVREFTPTFLSGFYAETADVDPEVYREDAEGLAADVTFDKVKDDPVFRKHGIQESGRRQKAAELCTCCKGEDSAMFPVWFMSYRNGDRIAYAAVNGQKFNGSGCPAVFPAESVSDPASVGTAGMQRRTGRGCGISLLQGACEDSFSGDGPGGSGTYGKKSRQVEAEEGETAFCQKERNIDYGAVVYPGNRGDTDSGSGGRNVSRLADSRNCHGSGLCGRSAEVQEAGEVKRRTGISVCGGGGAAWMCDRDVEAGLRSVVLRCGTVDSADGDFYSVGHHTEL